MRKLAMTAGSFLFLALVLPAVSQAKSLEELLVDKGVITKSEARASGHDHGTNVHWNDGTRLDFAGEGFSAVINTTIQTRYEFTDNDDGTDNTSSFEINAARLGVSGSALHEEFDYNVEIEFADGDAELLDAWLQWNACDWGGFRMGQQKTDYSRQAGTHISQLQFADRSVVSDYFSFGRQNGLRVHADVSSDVYVSAGIYNGLSDGEGSNAGGTDTKHMGVIAIRGDVMGEMDHLSEGDVGMTDDTAISIGAALAFAENEIAALGTEATDEVALSADFNIKDAGLSVHGEFFWLEHDPDVGSSIESIGFYTQLGYFFDEMWEGAVRYGFIDCDDGAGIGNDISGGIAGGTNTCAGNDDVNAVDVSFNYYWWAHNLKAQIGYSFLNEDPADSSADDVNTNRWILQLSSWF